MAVQHGQQDQGIQPFQIGEDESVVDFLQRQTWFEALQRATQKHSEFMQPYANPGDFPAMEYGYPNIAGHPELPPGGTDIEIFNPNNGVCALACYSPLYCDDDVECHFIISTTPPGMDPHEAPAHWQMQAFEKTGTSVRESLVSQDRLSITSHLTESDLDELYKKKTPTWTRKTQADSIFPIRVAPPAGGWPKWPDDPMTNLRVVAVDAAGNVCESTVGVVCYVKDCCQKDTYVAVSFDDDSTADTIAQSSSISVYVSNGCRPYVWSVSGTGFTLGAPSTDGLVNTLTASGSACGVATITVTDDCGNSTTGYVRCTAGDWDTIETICGVAQSYTAGCTGNIIGGIYRYGIHMKLAVTPCAPDESFPCCAIIRANNAAYGFVSGSCGAYCGSDFGLASPNDIRCFVWTGAWPGWVTWAFKQEWKCA